MRDAVVYVHEVDKLEDRRVSGFWKLTWLQVVQRLLLWVIAVYIGEKGFLNPHSPKFIINTNVDYFSDVLEIADFISKPIQPFLHNLGKTKEDRTADL